MGHLGAAKWIGKESRAVRLGQLKAEVMLEVSGSEKLGSIAPDNSSLVTGQSGS